MADRRESGSVSRIPGYWWVWIAFQVLVILLRLVVVPTEMRLVLLIPYWLATSIGVVFVVADSYDRLYAYMERHHPEEARKVFYLWGIDPRPKDRSGGWDGSWLLTTGLDFGDPKLREMKAELRRTWFFAKVASFVSFLLSFWL